MLSFNEIYKFYYEWWKNIDKTLFLLIIFLFGLGLFFSLVSTSLIASDKLDTNNYFFFFRHLIFILLGIGVLIFFSSLSEKNLFKISLYLFFISIFFLILVPIIGVEVKGSRRWLNLFFLPRFQPIELVKPFVIIFIATILCIEKNFNIFFKYVISFIAILPIIFLLVIQPDIGQTLLVFLSWATLIFVSGISLPIIISALSFLLSIFIYMIFFIPKFLYIKSRILSFFNPNSGTHNFQSDKAIDAISSGGYFGKGIGEGTLKNRVPEAHTDYIVSVISEEFGVIAIILLLILFLFFIYTVFKKIYLEKSEKIKLILTGIISLLIFQALIHFGVNIRLFPTTGMTLPFLSYGGSSIIGVSILSGILLNLTKRKVN
ncbi:MAG: FtsW/RodA/SpoVE family cell cycle protein [Candidatus Pelagibacter bacterium]|nr:FtsW/RodA/SpoVE family cell cycle protein [Candidatus Pelagibacter bacterium]